MILLMLSFLISKKYNYDHGTDTFATIAGIDWSGNQTFSQKVKRCLCDVHTNIVLNTTVP